jgi:hypothetical protein
MAAGLSQAQKAQHSREVLKRIQAQIGGDYRPARRAGLVASLNLGGGASLYLSWSSMSNGASVGTLVAQNNARNVRVEGRYCEPVSELLARLAAV